MNNKFSLKDLIILTFRFLPGIIPVPCETTSDVSAKENFELSRKLIDTNPDELFIMVLVQAESILKVCVTRLTELELFLGFLLRWGENAFLATFAEATLLSWPTLFDPVLTSQVTLLRHQT